MVSRSVSKSLLATVLFALCYAGEGTDSGLRGPSLDLEQSQRRITANNKPKKPKVKAARTKAQDEAVLQAAKHAHGGHDCELEVTFITPEFNSRAGSRKDIRKWERSLAKSSREDVGVFGTLELKKVDVEWQAAVPVDMSNPRHRALLENINHQSQRELPEGNAFGYWYTRYYKEGFIRGLNTVKFWSDLGKCQHCDMAKDNWEGNSRNLKGLSDAASALFAEDVFNNFRAEKDEWMENLVYLHVQGDCGPALKIDALYKAPPPLGMPLVVDGAMNKKPLAVNEGKPALIVDGAS